MASLLLFFIYLSFIGLGLPDSLLGAAWPVMYEGFGVPVSSAGLITMVVSMGTVTSSLLSDRLTRRFGAGMVTAVSTALTALSLFGFSTCSHFGLLLLWAVPYGLGAGSVDAALNNYVATHYASRHMSWLHAMWGAGTIVGPYVIGHSLSSGMAWSSGYSAVSLIQAALALVLFFSLPLWKKPAALSDAAGGAAKALSLPEIFRLPGARELMCSFFCYCALEQVAILWGSTYMVLHCGISEETAARFASLFLIGITAGRLLSGFFTLKFSDVQMIRGSFVMVLAGVLLILLPLGNVLVLSGLVILGLGCAAIYPCIIHSTPANFGPDKSQALIGVQMASAYSGIVTIPPLFGLIAQHISVGLFPFFILIFVLLMIFCYERMLKKVK